ncbi:hypothetical protein EVAR_23552_1 [Eumeta japonica]|uniref:Uncharacterized protein n=1 Tax=Eumeta variegata TaxID=151549 RepID=A0A4C1WYJ9_EUMVA|nr:hypothetical protein EVAR_23552_1 [Eumeta japonica]
MSVIETDIRIESGTVGGSNSGTCGSECGTAVGIRMTGIHSMSTRVKPLAHLNHTKTLISVDLRLVKWMRNGWYVYVYKIVVYVLVVVVIWSYKYEMLLLKEPASTSLTPCACVGVLCTEASSRPKLTRDRCVLGEAGGSRRCHHIVDDGRRQLRLAVGQRRGHASTEHSRDEPVRRRPASSTNTPVDRGSSLRLLALERVSRACLADVLIEL